MSYSTPRNVYSQQTPARDKWTPPGRPRGGKRKEAVPGSGRGRPAKGFDHEKREWVR